MNLFNQNYHIQIHTLVANLKKKKKTWGAGRILGKDH